MSSGLVTVHLDPDQLDIADSVMVIALDGWVDAGFGMRSASEIMLKDHSERLVASFDADLLIDHRARRPTMTVRDGRVDDINWPAIRLLAVSDLDQRDFLMLHGPEPDFRWQAFCSAVGSLVQQLRVARIVSIGAYPAAVPHTRPVRLMAAGTSPELIKGFGAPQRTLEVPAGISAVLANQFEASGLETVSVWAQVPHYAAGSPFPAGTAALFQGLRAAADLRFDPAPLIAEGLEVSRRLDTMIAQNAGHQRLLGRLESAYDSALREQSTEIPSGEELVRELERFLRDQDESK
ncbi:proteasome assembly chaperone family protein [Candidatus Poriferisocius sp.]|uniref:proteasome assembly chaperone family protein n=1 Tax=Candidatus Poriferisocius sp. TaxID=3101276 RepID=UPI003B015D54